MNCTAACTSTDDLCANVNNKMHILCQLEVMS